MFSNCKSSSSFSVSVKTNRAFFATFSSKSRLIIIWVIDTPYKRKPIKNPNVTIKQRIIQKNGQQSDGHAPGVSPRNESHNPSWLHAKQSIMQLTLVSFSSQILLPQKKRGNPLVSMPSRDFLLGMRPAPEPAQNKVPKPYNTMPTIAAITVSFKTRSNDASWFDFFSKTISSEDESMTIT